MSPLPLGYATVLDRIISLLQVMHTAKYTKVDASYKNCHIDTRPYAREVGVKTLP